MLKKPGIAREMLRGASPWNPCGIAEKPVTSFRVRVLTSSTLTLPVKQLEVKK